MCGRYTLTSDEDQIAEEFELIEPVRFARRYNIAPTQSAPVIRATDDGQRHVDSLRWGFIPSWAADASFGARTINARSETVAASAVFRTSFRRRRCIVPASGFFEWKKSSEGQKPRKQPFYIQRCDERPFGLAGLWDEWTNDAGEVLGTFTILTTTPNDLMRSLHDRMPVILHRTYYNQWLSPHVVEMASLPSLLRPFPAEGLTAYAVGPRVNRAVVDDAACIAPAIEPPMFDFDTQC